PLAVLPRSPGEGVREDVALGQGDLFDDVPSRGEVPPQVVGSYLLRRRPQCMDEKGADQNRQPASMFVQGRGASMILLLLAYRTRRFQASSPFHHLRSLLSCRRSFSFEIAPRPT